jgi:hypothetical protein
VTILRKKFNPTGFARTMPRTAELVMQRIRGTQSSAAVMQQVAAGSLNLGTTGLADSLRAADNGAPTRLVRIGVGVSPYEVGRGR